MEAGLAEQVWSARFSNPYGHRYSQGGLNFSLLVHSFRIQIN
jgi:hypothetical protein